MVAAPSTRKPARHDHRSTRKAIGVPVTIMVLSPNGLDNIGYASLDLIIANSLLQYLQHREFEDLLDIWHGKLKPAGQLVLADVLPPDLDAIADVKALLDFAWRGGFLLAALAGLGKTFFSDYRRLRNDVGLTRYAPEDMFTLLAAHGFAGEQRPTNVGHNQLRMTFVARQA